MVQLNLYIPKDKERLVRALDAAAKRSRRPKNELIMEALERYLAAEGAQLGVFHLGEVRFPAKRDELYLARGD